MIYGSAHGKTINEVFSEVNLGIKYLNTKKTATYNRLPSALRRHHTTLPFTFSIVHQSESHGQFQEKSSFSTIHSSLIKDLMILRCFYGVSCVQGRMHLTFPFKANLGLNSKGLIVLFSEKSPHTLPLRNILSLKNYGDS